MLNPDPTPEQVLFPGTEVVIPKFGKVHVFPCGIVQLQKYTNAIGETVATIVSLSLKKNVDLKLQLMANLVPHLMTSQLLSLVLECTKVLEPAGIGVERIPIWGLTKIIEAWLTENFGGDKLDPWLAVADRILSVMAKRDVRISEMLSKLSSQEGTPSAKSATAETSGTPIPAGA